mgnify:CR=1 FL=1
MNLNTLAPAEGEKKSAKRVGRGIGSGLGKTCGRGHKGQKSRSGGFHKRGFEGGQMPLARRLPKFGFSNANFKKVYEIVNLKDLEGLSGDVTPEVLQSKGLVNKGPIKILGQGEIKSALNIKAHKFSKTAKAAIEAAGGKVEVI